MKDSSKPQSESCIQDLFPDYGFRSLTHDVRRGQRREEAEPLSRAVAIIRLFAAYSKRKVWAMCCRKFVRIDQNYLILYTTS